MAHRLSDLSPPKPPPVPPRTARAALHYLQAMDLRFPRNTDATHPARATAPPTSSFPPGKAAPPDGRRNPPPVSAAAAPEPSKIPAAPRSPASRSAGDVGSHRPSPILGESGEPVRCAPRRTEMREPPQTRPGLLPLLLQEEAAQGLRLEEVGLEETRGRAERLSVYEPRKAAGRIHASTRPAAKW